MAMSQPNVIPLREKPTMLQRVQLLKPIISSEERSMLTTIKSLYDANRAKTLLAMDLIEKLPGSLTHKALADKLAKLKVTPVMVTTDNGKGFGYHRDQFERIWARYKIKVPAAKVPAPAPAKVAPKVLLNTPIPAPVPMAVPVQRVPLKKVQKFDLLHWVTITTALVLAAISAYFSVNGMTRIFPGMVLPILIMASVMEVGKLVGAAWLSRHWSDPGFWLIKPILMVLVTILATINAAGVYGQLSAAHLEPHTQATGIINVQAVEAKTRLAAQRVVIADLTRQIDQIDNAVTVATSKGRTSSAMDIVNENRHKRETLVGQRMVAENALIPMEIEAAKVEGTVAKVNADIGVMEYAAGLFGIPTERMIQVLILAMVLSCDPLSIIFVIATAKRRRAIEGAKA